jgi:hypothetical protein
MKFQHKMALGVLGGILAVLIVFLIIAATKGDETNADNGGGAGISRLHPGMSALPSGRVRTA